MPKLPPKKPSGIIPLTNDPNLMQRVLADAADLGVVGERKLIGALYLIYTTRILDRPASVLVYGGSSSGKSFITDTVLRLMPEECVINATRQSPTWIDRYEGSLDHKILRIGERSHQKDDRARDRTSSLRQLQSEGRVSSIVTEKVGDGYEAKQREKFGSVCVVQTTTVNPSDIFQEDLNRVFLLTTDDSIHQTKEVQRCIAQQFIVNGEGPSPAAIIKRHVEFQRSLKPYKVFIPFAEKVAMAIPPSRLEARRVTRYVLNLIQASTLLHQYQRQKDHSGRLIATLDDYRIAADVLRKPLQSSVAATEATMTVWKTLNEKFGVSEFTTTDAAPHLGTLGDVIKEAGRMAKYRRLDELLHYGALLQVAKGVGKKPAVWRLTGRSPQSDTLPKPEDLV